MDNLGLKLDNQDPKMFAGEMYGSRIRWNDGAEGSSGESEAGEVVKASADGDAGGESPVKEETHWLGDLVENPAVSKFKDKEPTDLAKSYIEAQSLIGGEKLAIPKEEDSELWNDVWNRLGRPEEPDGYELDTDRLEDSLMDDEALSKVKEVAHEKGVTNDQFQTLVNTYLDITNEKNETFRNETQRKMEEDIEGLKKEWGGAFDERSKVAQKAYNTLVGDNEALKAKMEQGLGNDPDIVKMFYKIGSQLSEDAIEGKSKSLSMTPEQAKKEIESIKTNPNSAFNDDTNAEHELAKERMEQLYRWAYPSLAE